MEDKITISIFLKVGEDFAMGNFKQEFDLSEFIYSEKNRVQTVNLIQSKLYELEKQIVIGGGNYRFTISIWIGDEFNKKFNPLNFTINSFDKTIQEFVESKIVNSEIKNIF